MSIVGVENFKCFLLIQNNKTVEVVILIATSTFIILLIF